MAKKHLAYSPIRDLMKSVGAQVVARDAVELLISFLEDKAKEISTKALKLTRHAKRIKVIREDIDFVIK